MLIYLILNMDNNKDINDQKDDEKTGCCKDNNKSNKDNKDTTCCNENNNMEGCCKNSSEIKPTIVSNDEENKNVEYLRGKKEGKLDFKSN